MEAPMRGNAGGAQPTSGVVFPSHLQRPRQAPPPPPRGRADSSEAVTSTSSSPASSSPSFPSLPPSLPPAASSPPAAASPLQLSSTSSLPAGALGAGVQLGSTSRPAIPPRPPRNAIPSAVGSGSASVVPQSSPQLASGAGAESGSTPASSSPPKASSLSSSTESLTSPISSPALEDSPSLQASTSPIHSPGRSLPAASSNPSESGSANRIPIPPRPVLRRNSAASTSSPSFTQDSLPGRKATAPSALTSSLPDTNRKTIISTTTSTSPSLVQAFTRTTSPSSPQSSAVPSLPTFNSSPTLLGSTLKTAAPLVPPKNRVNTIPIPPRPLLPKAAQSLSSSALDLEKKGIADHHTKIATISDAGAGNEEVRARVVPLDEDGRDQEQGDHKGSGSVVERRITKKPPVLSSSFSAASNAGHAVQTMNRRMPPPIPPSSSKPTLKPRPGHRRSRSYDPATMRMTLIRPFDPINMQAKTMEDHKPRAVAALRREAASQLSDSEDSDVDEGNGASGGNGLGMMSMCLGVNPSMSTRARSRTGGASQARTLRASDKADKKSKLKEEKKEKERKGFWKKKKDAKETQDSKSERSLSADEAKTNAEAYQQLFQVMDREDLIMARLLLSVVKRPDRDQASTTYVQYYSSRGLLLSLVSHLIHLEVDTTVEPGTLLRSNNSLSSLLSKHLQLVGRSYLRRVLHPIITQVIETATETNFEVNPTRLEELGAPGVDLGRNTENVLFVASQVLHALNATIHYCPMSIRETCQELVRIVAYKYPDAITSVVGGYFFLRYLCPALLAPEAFGLVDEGALSAPARRALILVSKVLQQLANGLSFGMKESYMVAFNPFLEQNEAPVRDYLRLLATIGEDETQRGDEDQLDVNENEVRSNLSKLLFDNKESINKTLASGEHGIVSPVLSQVDEEWKRISPRLLAPLPRT